MLVVRPPYALWSIWEQLSGLQHAYVLILCVLCIYSGFSVVSVMLRLRSIKDLRSDDIASAEYGVDELRNRCATLKCVITACFYLFGIVLFLSLQSIGSYIVGGAVEAQLLGSFIIDCVFATNVFAVFLILHLVQWFVVGRVRAYAGRPRQ